MATSKKGAKKAGGKSAAKGAGARKGGAQKSSAQGGARQGGGQPAKKGGEQSSKKGGGQSTKGGGQSSSKRQGGKQGGQSPPQGEQQQPASPMPAQHQPRPGIEAEMQPRPRYAAPLYRGSDKLRGKAALVTGGDSGIGRAVAVLFAREGADVGIVYLEEEQRDAEETRRAVEAEGRRALLLPGDVRSPDFCREAVERAAREFGRLDILVNNAAYQRHQKSLEDVSEEQWDRTFRTNIYGYFYMARAALRHLRPGSSIINCGSITGIEGNKELLDYSSTKGAIHAFTKSLAQNLVERGVRVNCVAPGPVWTPLNVADKPAEEVAEHGADSPMKRPAQPEEIAPAFVFFASEADSSYITGEVITLLGGDTTGAA